MVTPDFASLVAALSAAQASTRTAFVETRRRSTPPAASLVETLTLLFTGRNGWADGGSATGHAFNPVVARMLSATPRQPS